MKGDLRPLRQKRGTQARLDGGRAEWAAALLLMAKGYRILGMRLRTPQAEVDLAAVRGDVLAIVEVKRRRTLDEALLAVTPGQRARLKRAGQALAARGQRLPGPLQPRAAGEPSRPSCVWTWWRSRRAGGRVILPTHGATWD